MADDGRRLTRVDFYSTRADGPLVRERIACRLVEKAVRLGHRLHIHLVGEQELAALDELLWTYRDASFVPHARMGTDDAVAVTLGTGDAPEPVPQVLVILHPEIPSFFSRFERVAEIVSADSEVLETGRKHFRFYRDRGYPLQHHEL